MPSMNSALRVPVLFYHQYLGADSQSVYTTHSFCGSCRQDIGTAYATPRYPENLEEENETGRGWHSFDRDDTEPLAYFTCCPWCGVEFEDEWWKDRTIQNERVIDHYQNPGTHKGDTHQFLGDGPDCITGHWLGTTGSEVCWCDPEIEPGIMGCVIRHQDKNYEDAMALRRESAPDVDADDWDDDYDW